MYDPKSPVADDFINDAEILATLEYAAANKHNRALIDAILEKAKECRGLSHREAAVLLDCDLPDEEEKMFALAREIKRKFYGNRIVMFAPLYLSNYCINGCVYCPYHRTNTHIRRKKLTQQEIAAEVTALQDMGHKRLAIETGEDPKNNPIEYVLESIRTIYGIKHKNGAIRRVNVNIAATTVENYRLLKEAGIGTYILFQETYHRKTYEELHPSGPKHDYRYHTEAMDRAMEGGIDDVGCGVLFGLNLYRYDFVGLLMHAEHLEAAKGVGPHTISVPRIRPADDSLNINIGWNGFDANLQFTGGALFQVSMTGTYFNENDDNTIWTQTFKEGGNSPLFLVENAYSLDNPDGTFPRLTLSATGHGGDNGLSSSFWWRDGTYVRLKTAQLGYTLPAGFTRRFGVEALRFFVEGNNLFTIDGLPEGIDPESPGVNNGYYPQQRNLMGGVTITF